MLSNNAGFMEFMNVLEVTRALVGPSADFDHWWNHRYQQEVRPELDELSTIPRIEDFIGAYALASKGQIEDLLAACTEEALEAAGDIRIDLVEELLCQTRLIAAEAAGAGAATALPEATVADAPAQEPQAQLAANHCLARAA